MSAKEEFDDCMVLSKEAFDPDAVFLDDIVDDGVLPYLSMAVDGLDEKVSEEMLLRPEDVANEEAPVDTSIPATSLDPDHLEVLGWESSLLRKIKGYIGI